MPSATPAPELLDPANHVLLLCDHQSQLAFAVRSIDAVTLRDHIALIAHAARNFGVPAILTTLAEKTISGPPFDELRRVFGDGFQIARTNLNPWEDERVVSAIGTFDKQRLVVAGLWTSISVTAACLSAAAQGYAVYFIADACGDVSPAAHDLAVQRLMQAGCRPLTAMQYLLELQRDFAREASYDATIRTLVDHASRYGMGLIYGRG